jgi:hypothetical protein
MNEKELLNYLDGKFASFDLRVSALERELNHTHKNMLSEDRAQKIFRAEVLKVNTHTRIAVALIAAIALIGNGTQHALASHDQATLKLRCEEGTDKAMQDQEVKRASRDQLLVDSAAMRAVQLRDQQIDVLKGTP